MAACSSPRQSTTLLMVLVDSPRQSGLFYGSSDSPRQVLTGLTWVADSPRATATRVLGADFYAVFVAASSEALRMVPHGFGSLVDSPRQARTTLEWHEESPRQARTILEV